MNGELMRTCLRIVRLPLHILCLPFSFSLFYFHQLLGLVSSLAELYGLCRPHSARSLWTASDDPNALLLPCNILQQDTAACFVTFYFLGNAA